MLKVVALIAAATAGCVVTVSAGGGGHSTSFRKQDDYGNYAFGYDIQNGYGAVNGRKESGSHAGVVGSYYIGDIDGRQRTVHYVADKLGFRAQIKTNEPGTKTSLTAGATYDSANGKLTPSGGLHVAPQVVAPVVVAKPSFAVYAPAAYGAYGAYGGHEHFGYGVPFHG